MPQRGENAATEFIHSANLVGYTFSQGPQTWHVVTPRSPVEGDRVYIVHQDDPVVGLYKGVHIEGDQQVYRVEEVEIVGVVVATIILPPRNPEKKTTPSQDQPAESCETITANT